jgi:hypothetical protein
MSSIDVPQANPATSHPDSSRPRGARPTWLHHLSFTNMSVIYAEIALIVIFSLWAPHTFPSWTTVKSVLNGNAIAGLMALSLVVPLSGRIFDLSVGEALGLAERPVIWSGQYHNVPALPSDNSFPGVVTSYQAQYEKLWGK